MKHAIVIFAILFSVTSYGQTPKKGEVAIHNADGSVTIRPDTAKAILPLPPAAEKVFFLVLPEKDWNTVIGLLRKSTAPSNVIEDAVSFIINNVKELKPPVEDKTKK